MSDREHIVLPTSHGVYNEKTGKNEAWATEDLMIPTGKKPKKRCKDEQDEMWDEIEKAKFDGRDGRFGNWDRELQDWLYGGTMKNEGKRADAVLKRCYAWLHTTRPDLFNGIPLSELEKQLGLKRTALAQHAKDFSERFSPVPAMDNADESGESDEDDADADDTAPTDQDARQDDGQDDEA